MLNKICTWTAKSAPYPPCTVTAFWLKYQDPARCLRRVTQPPHIAGPLVVMLGAAQSLISALYNIICVARQIQNTRQSVNPKSLKSTIPVPGQQQISKSFVPLLTFVILKPALPH